MKRLALAALIAAVLCPAAGTAQTMYDFERPVWGPRLRVTPFVGFAAAASRIERWTVTAINGGGTSREEWDVSMAAGPVAGLTVEKQAFERFAVAVSGAVVSRGRTLEHQTGDAQLFEYKGSNFLFAKAVGLVRLREEVSEIQVHTMTGSLFVGPAWVREMPKQDASMSPVRLEPLNHWGLSFGFDAEIPLPFDRLSFTAGLEDYVIWWNTTEIARRNDALIAANGGESSSFVESGPSHNLLFRAGLSVRFR
jgi:hypothetical protein